MKNSEGENQRRPRVEVVEAEWAESEGENQRGLNRNGRCGRDGVGMIGEKRGGRSRRDKTEGVKSEG